MRIVRFPALALVALVLAPASLLFGHRDSALAHQISGAIFTTTATGSEVNQNIFPNVQAVYLDGGPGPGAPQTAAGLDDGRYVFQVTNPNGQTLLSTDAAKCRRFDVANGVITNVVAAGGCEHVTGVDQDHNATTVQLFPFNTTPNPGGVYKVWVTREVDYLLGCTQLGVNNGLDVVNCGNGNPADRHGFIPAHSKTDNFKVRRGTDGVELDIRFFSDRNGNVVYDPASEPTLCGIAADWTDTNGVTNTRYSSSFGAQGCWWHIEAAETGVHQITLSNNNGCVITGVNGVPGGGQTVTLNVDPKKASYIIIDVACLYD